jgi:hypothetical protein
MEGQSAHVPESNAQGNGLKSRFRWYNSCKARTTRTHAAASRLSATNWSIEGSAQDSKGEEWDGDGMVGVGGKRRGRGGRWRESEMMLVVVRGSTRRRRQLGSGATVVA